MSNQKASKTSLTIKKVLLIVAAISITIKQ